MQLLRINKSLEAGFSLMEVLISVALLSIVIGTSINLNFQMQKNMSALKFKQDLLDLRRQITQEVHCAKSVVPLYNHTTGSVDCSAGIVLRNDFGQPININSKGWRITHQSCTPSGIQVRVEKRLNGQIQKHPIYDELLNDANSRINPVFGTSSPHSLCNSFFNSRPRIRVFRAPLGALSPARDLTECNRISSTVVSSPPNLSPLHPTSITWGNQFKLPHRFHDSCSNYCVESPRFYHGGYFAECNPASREVDCVCLR